MNLKKKLEEFVQELKAKYNNESINGNYFLLSVNRFSLNENFEGLYTHKNEARQAAQERR